MAVPGIQESTDAEGLDSFSMTCSFFIEPQNFEMSSGRSVCGYRNGEKSGPRGFRGA